MITPVCQRWRARRDLYRPIGERDAQAEEELASLVGNALCAYFAPTDLAESLEETAFVLVAGDAIARNGGERRLLRCAWERGVLAKVPLPIFRTPFTLVEFLTSQAGALLAPVMLAEERP